MLQQGYFILASGSMLLFFTNLIGIVFSAIIVFFPLGLKHKRNRNWFYAGSITQVLLGSATIPPLALNYDKFSSGTQFHNSIYAKTGKILNLSKVSPLIKNISTQGNSTIVVIEPFSNNTKEIERLTHEIEQSTGLQISLKDYSNEKYNIK